MGLKERFDRTPVVGSALAVAERFGRDRGGYLAAAVTYRAFLSLFPLLLLGLSAIGFVLAGRPDLERQLATSLSEQIPGLRVVLGDNLRALVEARAASGILGVAGLLWTGLGATEAAGFAVSRVFRVQPNLPFLKRKLWSLGTTLALGGLGILGVAVVAVVGNVTVEGPAGVLLRIAGPATGFAIDVGFFLLAYRLLTQRRGPSFRRLWKGAILAAAGWGILKVLGTWYVARTVARTEAVYGALAGAIGILLLLYLAAQLLLLGAELNAVVRERAGYRFAVSGERVFLKEEPMEETKGNGSRSMGELVRSIATDTATLVRKEVELARQELLEGVKAKVRGAGALAAAGLVAVLALAFLGSAMGAALATVMATWLAWLLTAAAFLVVAGIAAAVGVSWIKRPVVRPERSKESLKEDVRWARAQLRR